MRRMAARAGRHFLVFFLLESLAVNRRVILGDLIHSQRGIVLPHEVRVAVALAAYFDNLKGGGLADVAFLPVHRFEAHDGGIAAVTRHATKTLGGMDI